jgi:hypothetical protein
MFEKEFFIVPVPVPLPLPDLPCGDSPRPTGTIGDEQRVRRRPSDPFRAGAGHGHGHGRGHEMHAGTAEPHGVHGRRPWFHSTQ